MRQHLAGLEKIRRLSEVRIEATKQLIATKSNLKRMLEARLAELQVAYEETETQAQHDEQEALRKLIGHAVVAFDLYKLQLIRTTADNQKALLAAESADVAQQIVMINDELKRLNEDLAQFLKRDHRIAAVCSKLAGRLRITDDLAEERSITERL